MAPKIAIIGAGPGGCMLARLLHQNNISCTIFEGEKSIDYRSQGGTLDLRARSGLLAIQKAGLYDEFLKHARYDGEALLITDKNLVTWLRRGASKHGEKNQVQEAPEIDRSVLRKILIESLPKEIVRWGCRLLRVESDLSLHFENGQVEHGYDLVIGADGAFSKVRHSLTSERPYYSGIGGYMFQIPDADKRAPECYKFVNRGSVFAYSDLKNFNGQQLGDGSINVSFWAQREEDWMKKLDFDPTDMNAVRKELLDKELHDWSPQLRQLVEKSEGPVLARNLYMLPVGCRFDHKRGITVLGDAAHVMTPFAGIGVNTAFYDAMLLTDQIVEYTQSGEKDDFDTYILKYEDKMWAEAKEKQELTYNTMTDFVLTPGAPRATIESWALRHIKAEFPGFIYPFVAASVYIGYFFYKLFV